MKSHNSVIRAGIIAGSFGAISVIIWFAITDLIGGQPFFTAAALGSAVFSGVSDPALIEVSLLPILGYTVIHFLAFFAVAIGAAYVFKDAIKNQGTLLYALEFFIILEVGFYLTVGILFTPLLGKFAWINIALGNLISSLAMGIYFYRTEPVLKKGLF